MCTKHIETAADLVRFGASVMIECGACGAAKDNDRVEVVKPCGAGSLKACEWRLKCSRCGAKKLG
jgi:hypothetical protein